MRLLISDIVEVVGAEVRGGDAAVSGADVGSTEITSMVFDARKLWGLDRSSAMFLALA